MISTGIRVPAMTGLPNIILGLMVILSLGFMYILYYKNQLAQKDKILTLPLAIEINPLI